MINKIASQILSFISKQLEISPEMRDIYQYGIEIALSSMLNILLVTLCALILKNFYAGLIYLFIFIFLRSYTGGYHASTYFRCNLTFVVTFIVTFCFYKIIMFCNTPIYVHEAIALANLIPIAVYSPVPNKHKALTDKQKARSHNLSLIIASALSLIGLVLIVLDIHIGAMIINTVTMVSVLIIIETFMQRRGYHES